MRHGNGASGTVTITVCSSVVGTRGGGGALFWLLGLLGLLGLLALTRWPRRPRRST